MSKDGTSRTQEDPVLRVANLRVRYPNGGLGVLDVSLQIFPGQVVGLFGPNGSGKTTTVRATSGFLKSEGAKVVAGKVEFLGREVTNFEPHRQAKLGLSFVPEREKVFPGLSVAENLLAVGRLPRGPRRAEVLGFVHELFPVLAERRKQMAGSLSGGQRQMLAIARAMVTDPVVLIVDEMSLGLHESIQAPLFKAMRAVAETGTAVLVVDENTKYALGMSDYFYLLSDGVIAGEGTPDQLRDRDLLAATYTEVV
jgi:branched-chain amino acid transport system ATP-binding protein